MDVCLPKPAPPLGDPLEMAPVLSPDSIGINTPNQEMLEDD